MSSGSSPTFGSSSSVEELVAGKCALEAMFEDFEWIAYRMITHRSMCEDGCLRPV